MGKVYKFSEFILDKKAITLYHQNSPVQLSSRAFEMLLYLVEKRGEIVEKDEILDKIWKDSFVEEANLPVHISALRRVLQEKKGESRFIKTISGRGYSFIAEVEEIEANKPLSKAISLNKSSEKKNFSIAVLPFTIEQSSEDIEYLANGITQSLIGDLSTNQDLRVLAYSAVKPYKHSDLELQEIGFLLDADKILTGVISEYKEKWEISVELINAVDKSCIWATTETVEADNIFEVKKQISTAIVEKLKLKLIGNPNKTKEINTQAQKLYYRGKFILESRTTTKDLKEVLYQALKFFEEATNKESNYALAYIGIGSVYVSLFNHNLLDREESFQKAEKALRMALISDDSISDVYILKSTIEIYFKYDFTEAEKSLDKAIKLNPNNADAYNWKSVVYRCIKKFDESLNLAQKATSLDPISVRFNENVVRSFFFMEEYKRSIIQADELIEFNNEALTAYFFKALSYTALGDFSEAFKNINQVLSLRETSEVLLNKAYIYALANEKEKSLEVINKVLSNPDSNLDYTNVALAYIALDKMDEAFSALNKALNTSGNIYLVKADPRFKPLHQDKRFDKFLEKLNLL